MTSSQQSMATGGPRPAAGQVPPQAMVLQHTHNPQGQIMPIMTAPAAGHFAPGGNFATQIPLQHPQRQLMNNIPPGPHANYPTIHGNQAALTITRPAQMRQLQQTSIPPNAATLSQLGPYQPQMQSQIHPQHLQMQQQFQQANPALRLSAQHSLIPGHNVVQPQPIASPAIQHMGGPQGPQPAVSPRHPLLLQRLTQFVWHLSNIHQDKTKESYWLKFVQEWFVPQAKLRLVLSEAGQRSKEFELPNVLIHHFFHRVHTSGVRQMYVVLGTLDVDSGIHLIHCPHASIIYRLENGSQLVWDGPFKVQFKPAGQELKIERLELVDDEFTEFIPKNPKQTVTPPLSNRSISPETKRSPLERSALGQTSNDVRGGPDQGEERAMPPPDPEINDIGVPKILMTFLEVAEVCVCIQPLIEFSRVSDLSPQQALQMYPTAQPTKQFQQGPNAFTYLPQSTQLGSPMNEMSPMVPHASVPGLTNSPQPHHPSPMSSQTSQAGATGPNTTPLIPNRQPPSKMLQSNKRRRGSAAANMAMKEEDEEILSNPPPKPSKQSPRIGLNSRGGGPSGPSNKRIRSDS